MSDARLYTGVFSLFCLWGFGLYHYGSIVMDLNKKESLTEDEKTSKTNASLVLAALVIVAVVVVFIYFKYFYNTQTQAPPQPQPQQQIQMS